MVISQKVIGRMSPNLVWHSFSTDPSWVANYKEIRRGHVNFMLIWYGMTHMSHTYAGVCVFYLTCFSYTVPLNYNFTFTRVSTRVTTRGSRGRCQNLLWKGSFPRDGPWLFHAKTRGISRHVAFPRDDTWHFHKTSRGISTRSVTVESRVEYSRDQ